MAIGLAAGSYTIRSENTDQNLTGKGVRSWRRCPAWTQRGPRGALPRPALDCYSRAFGHRTTGAMPGHPGRKAMRMVVLSAAVTALLGISGAAAVPARPVAISRAALGLAPAFEAGCWFRRWCGPARCHRTFVCR